MPGMARIAHRTTGMLAGLMKNDFVEIAKDHRAGSGQGDD